MAENIIVVSLTDPDADFTTIGDAMKASKDGDVISIDGGIYAKTLTTSSEKNQFFAYTFHTFLRKELDSDGSSICWNAIHLLDKKDWSRFISNVKGKTINKQTCLDAIDYGDYARSLFIIGLRQMEDKEYEALNDFLNST